ncbi:MAG: leucine-rich repeat protein [Kiritimatiellia bacterium]
MTWMKLAACCVLGVAAAADAEENIGPWVYYPSEGVISNGVGASAGWRVRVSVKDSARRQLSIGTNAVDSAYVYDENGAIYGAETLDLRERITTEDGEQWTIISLGSNYSFGLAGTSTQATPIRYFYAPRELQMLGGAQIFNKIPLPDGEKIQLAYFDCPVLTSGAVSYFFNSGKTVETVLNVPALTTLDERFLSDQSVNLAASDFSAVKTIGSYQSAWQPLRPTSSTPPQDLSFPSVETIADNAFKAGYFNKVSLGINGNTVKSIGSSAFAVANGWPQSLNEVVLGLAEGCTIGLKAFVTSDSCHLKTVTFLGAVPELAEGEIFGRPNQYNEDESVKTDYARTMLFCIPPAAAWDGVRAAAREPTADELQAYAARFPERRAPDGIVPASVFHTYTEQFLLTLTPEEVLAETGVRLTLAAHGPGDITVNGAPGVEDFVAETSRVYPYGTSIALAAAPRRGAFIGWEWLPSGATVDGAAAELTLTADARVRASFATDFVFDPSAMTLTDGTWILKVKSTDTAAGTLVLDANAVSLAPGALTDGVLDLRGRITDAATGASWTLNDFAGSAFKSANSIVHFYAPPALKSWPGQLFNGVSSLKTLVVRAPALTGKFGAWSWSFLGSALECVVLDVPKMTAFEDDSQFVSSPLSQTDLTTWDLSSVKTIGNNSSGTKGALQILGPGPSGALQLPALETVGTNAFKNWSRLEKIELGTGGKLQRVGATAFANCAALRTIDFGASKAFTCDANAFMLDETQPLNVAEFIWRGSGAPTRATVEAIVCGRAVGEDPSEKPVIIRVDPTARAWVRLIQPVEDAEKAGARRLSDQGELVAGVYVTDAGERVAWVVGFRREGLVLTIR